MLVLSASGFLRPEQNMGGKPNSLPLCELISKHVDLDNPANAFVSGQPLDQLFSDEISCWRNRGLAEALAVQGPEAWGMKIFDLLPAVMDARPVCEAFIERLLWRDPETISNTCLSYINQHIAIDDNLNRKLLNVFMTIAPNLKHPFNADFLHKNLMNCELAERDAWWSIFLYNEYGDKGTVDRLVDWAWSEADKSHIADESICLTGKALVWFLTTSHRFLRDRSTKALIALFTNRIGVLCQVLLEFAEVNDPYVSERLYAVAYGCSLRSNDQTAKSQLAKAVYSLVFVNDSPPSHILLRDYARGVIEVALRDEVDVEGIDVNKIRPPL